MTPKLIRRMVIGAAAILVLAVSLLLVSYARWLRGISAGNRELAGGDYAAAAKAYDAASQRLTRFPWVRTLGGPGYRQLVFNHARALYAAKQDDGLMQMLENEGRSAPFLTEDREFYFWTGNVQFRHAIAQKDKQTVQAGLQQAADAYRRALAAAPDDWDIKYNYELTVNLLASMRKGKDDQLEKIKKGQMKILKEETDKDKERQQKMAPEKRG